MRFLLTYRQSQSLRLIDRRSRHHGTAGHHPRALPATAPALVLLQAAGLVRVAAAHASATSSSARSGSIVRRVALVADRQAISFRHFFNVGTNDNRVITDADVEHDANAYRGPDYLRSAFEVYRALPANITLNADSAAKCLPFLRSRRVRRCSRRELEGSNQLADTRVIAAVALHHEPSRLRSEEGRHPDERGVPADADVVRRLRRGLVEVAALRWQAG
jgi:hypothetical protein